MQTWEARLPKMQLTKEVKEAAKEVTEAATEAVTAEAMAEAMAEVIIHPVNAEKTPPVVSAKDAVT
jgi:type II secretory pathway component PulM